MRSIVHGGSCGDSCCLRIEKLGVRIGAEEILHDISLHVHCGQLVAIIGPNGAGKSTLLKAILGQQEHSGSIRFSTPGERDRKMRIGYVPQSPAFDPGDPISVEDLFVCCLYKRPAFLGASKAMRERILECLDRVHAKDLLRKRVGTLSGGELQRVLLALALEPVPNLLILDEPLSGVDVEGISTLMDMLDELRRVYDLSIMMTTHDFSALRRYADQVVLVERQILRLGTPEEVLSSPEFYSAFHMKGDGTT